jgi:hypothetical protein
MKGCFRTIMDAIGLMVVGFLFIQFFSVYEPPLPEPSPQLDPEAPPAIYPQGVEYRRRPGGLLRKWTSLCYDTSTEVFKACDVRQVRPKVIPLIQSKNAGGFNLGIVCDIYDYVSRWEYIDDPFMKDYFSPASYSLNQRRGDCDDFAICLAAAMQAVGGYPRITFAVYPDIGHAFAEICLGPMPVATLRTYIINRYRLPPNAPIHYRTDEHDNLYLNLDWTKDYPGAPYRESLREITFYPIPRTCETFFYN